MDMDWKDIVNQNFQIPGLENSVPLPKTDAIEEPFSVPVSDVNIWEDVLRVQNGESPQGHNNVEYLENITKIAAQSALAQRRKQSIDKVEKQFSQNVQSAILECTLFQQEQYHNVFGETLWRKLEDMGLEYEDVMELIVSLDDSVTRSTSTQNREILKRYSNINLETL